MDRVYLIPSYLTETKLAVDEIPKGIEMIQAKELWEVGKKGENRVVAVIDTGCDIFHQDLKDNIIDVYNFTEDDNGEPHNVTDYSGHGTHVSGIIAASENGYGVIGVAPRSKLLILKVIGESGSTNYKTLNRAIKYAANWRGLNGEKVDVINLSLGGNIENSELHITIKEVIKSGVFIVAAAGNFGDGDGLTDEITFPGYYKELYQIGAVDYNLKVTNFSNSNGNIDFVAPGTDILSTFKNGQYAKLSGTSMAAPHVSGAIALLLNVIKVNFKTPADIVFDYLVKNAESTGRSFKEEGYGFIRLSKGAIQIGRQSKYLDNCNK